MTEREGRLSAEPQCVSLWVWICRKSSRLSGDCGKKSLEILPGQRKTHLVVTAVLLWGLSVWWPPLTGHTHILSPHIFTRTLDPTALCQQDSGSVSCRLPRILCCRRVISPVCYLTCACKTTCWVTVCSHVHMKHACAWARPSFALKYPFADTRLTPNPSDLRHSRRRFNDRISCSFWCFFELNCSSTEPLHQHSVHWSWPFVRWDYMRSHSFTESQSPLVMNGIRM